MRSFGCLIFEAGYGVGAFDNGQATLRRSYFNTFHALGPLVLTAKACRVRAAELSQLAAESTDAALTLRLETMAHDWAVLAATVAAMDDWEARFIHGRNTPRHPKKASLN